jgi:hypothetical protein
LPITRIIQALESRDTELAERLVSHTRRPCGTSKEYFLD